MLSGNAQHKMHELETFGSVYELDIWLGGACFYGIHEALGLTPSPTKLVNKM